jgi:LAS superfamily LD-carboxypeptidase LdcB
VLRVVATTAVAACLCLGGTAGARTVAGHTDGVKTELDTVRVGDVRVEVHTAKAFRAMERAAAKAHVHLSIRSGYRSYTQQAALYAKYKRGQGNLAAPAGYSHHESGRALDLVVKSDRVREWLRDHAAAYGFHRTVPGEAWHYEYIKGTESVVLDAPKSHHKHKPHPQS